MDETSSPLTTDFSIMQGGPAHRLLMRLGLLKPGMRSLAKTVLLFALLTWLPLLLLSLAQGLALGHSVAIPLLKDLATYARFMVALPLLIIAEYPFNQRIKMALAHLASSGLLRASDQPRFRAVVGRITTLNISPWIDLLLLALAYLRTLSLQHGETFVRLSNWHTLPGSADTLSLAGWWYLLVSAPIYQFFAYRWAWVFLLWALFLWRISRLELNLTPTHPDYAGGLAFLKEVTVTLGLVVLSQGALLSAVIGEIFILRRIPVTNYENIILGYILLAIIIILAPLFFFTLKLRLTKIIGLIQYSALGNLYTQTFHQKWVEGHNPTGESLLGASDIQSLADLSNSFAVVRNMRIVPFDRSTVLVIVLAAVLPFLPLVFTFVPVADVLHKLAGFFF